METVLRVLLLHPLGEEEEEEDRWISQNSLPDRDLFGSVRNVVPLQLNVSDQRRAVFHCLLQITGADFHTHTHTHNWVCHHQANMQRKIITTPEPFTDPWPPKQSQMQTTLNSHLGTIIAENNWRRVTGSGKGVPKNKTKKSMLRASAASPLQRSMVINEYISLVMCAGGSLLPCDTHEWFIDKTSKLGGTKPNDRATEHCSVLDGLWQSSLPFHYDFPIHQWSRRSLVASQIC